MGFFDFGEAERLIYIEKLRHLTHLELEDEVTQWQRQIDYASCRLAIAINEAINRLK